MARGGDKAALEVRGGMEMLGWTYTETDWQAHVLAERERLKNSELMRPGRPVASAPEPGLLLLAATGLLFLGALRLRGRKESRLSR